MARIDYYWKDKNGYVNCTSTENKEHQTTFDTAVKDHMGAKDTYDGKEICVFKKYPLDDLFGDVQWQS